jgi:hypothetical protein
MLRRLNDVNQLSDNDLHHVLYRLQDAKTKSVYKEPKRSKLNIIVYFFC